jgi:hypothetical protein
MSLSSPSTFLCVAGSCTVVDKNAHTIGAIHILYLILFYRKIMRQNEKDGYQEKHIKLSSDHVNLFFYALLDLRLVELNVL